MDSFRKMFHTQEDRGDVLKKPIPCKRTDAWLGEGCYFWDELEDAMMWGDNSKRRTQRYSVYNAIINMEDVLDTVFNEVNYKFFIKQIDKVAEAIIKKTNKKPTLKQVHFALRKKQVWNAVKGIMFQDIPINRNLSKIQPFDNGMVFTYKKRIQLVSYDNNIVLSFDHRFSENCK